jgi:hypothetical protein
MPTAESVTEHDLLDLAAFALHESAGLIMEVLERDDDAPAGTSRHGAVVRINQRTVLAEVKGTVDRVDALRNAQLQLRRLAEASAFAIDDTLLVTSHLTPYLLNACRELKLNAVDGSGNAHLAWENTIVVVSGRPRQTRTEERLGWTVTAVRLALIALAAPEELNSSQRAIATSAGISLGSVGPALDWLESRRFLLRRDSGISVMRRNELLAEWSVAYPARLRPRLKPQHFAAPSGTRQWAKAEIAPGEWSGEVAAALRHGDLRPATAELYVDPAARRDVVRRLVRDFHLRPDPAGELTVLDRFWGFDNSQDSETVPWPLVYADLLHIGDPRTTEAAARIKEDAHVN